MAQGSAREMPLQTSSQATENLGKYNIGGACVVNLAWTGKKSRVFQTFVLCWIFLDRDDRDHFPNSWVFPFFFLSDKTGHPYVPPSTHILTDIIK